MKIDVTVKWGEKELNELLTQELDRHGLKPKEGSFDWSVADCADGKGTEIVVEVQAEHVEQPMKTFPINAHLSQAVAGDPRIDMATLSQYVPKEAIGPLTKAFEEAEKREKFPGESKRRP